MHVDRKKPMGRLHSFFKIEVYDTVKKEITKEAYAYNILLNQGKPVIAAAVKNPLWRIFYGSGTGTLDETRANATGHVMFSLLGSKTGSTTVSRGYDPETRSVWITNSITILPAEHVGATFTEVGGAIRSHSSNWGPQINHAFFEDSEGNPISIGPKTDTEEITIYGTFYMSTVEGDEATGRLSIKNAFVESFYKTFGESGGSSSAYSPVPLGGGTYLCGVGAKLVDFECTNDPLEVLNLDSSFNLDPVDSAVSVGGGASLDVATGILTMTNARAQTTQANGEIWGIVRALTVPADTSGGNIPGFMYYVPAMKPEGFQITDKALGTGDGVETDFFAHPWGWAIPGTVEIKVNGVVADPSTYTLNHGPQTASGEVLVGSFGTFMGTTIRNEYMSDGHSIIAKTKDSTLYGAMDGYTFSRVAWDSYSTSAVWGTINVKGSTDGISWTNIGTTHAANYNISASNYTYLKFESNSDAHRLNRNFRIYAQYNKPFVEFNSPVPDTHPVTASYKVPYIPKDSVHVIDFSATAKWEFTQDLV